MSAATSDGALDALELPKAARLALETFIESAKRCFGDDLRSIVIYGTGAEGRLRATSDLNLLVVLRAFDGNKAAALREAFRFGEALQRLTTMFLLEDEIEAASRDFAQKFADISRRRVVLYGHDPLAGLEIPRQEIVRRVQQVLLNLALRMRERFVSAGTEDERATRVVAEATGPLRTSAAAILELSAGVTANPKEALQRVVESLHRPDLEALLPRLSAAREEGRFAAGEPAQVLLGLVALARALYQRSLEL